MGANRGDEAEPHLRKALEDAATAGDANGMLGYWFQSRGRFDEARACFERAIELNPLQAVSYYGWTQGNKVTPEQSWLLEKAEQVGTDPSTPPDEAMAFQYVLGKGYADLGDHERSMDWYDKANQTAFERNLGGRAFNRGRYAQLFDNTIATFSRETIDRNQRIGLPSKTPVFIVGMMRSGTTLVEQIVSSHPDVGAAGEVEFWLDEGPTAVDLGKRSLNAKKLVTVSAAYLKVLQSLAPGKPRATDKMPQNFQMLGHIHLGFPKAPIIHIRRNPIDTCLSIYTTAYQQSPAFAHDRESIVFAYKQYLRLVAHWRKVLPADRFLEVDYEELTADRDSVIRRIISFCGLEWNEACLHPESNDRLVVTPSLWQVRQPINRSAVDRWRVVEPWLGAFRQLLDD